MKTTTSSLSGCALLLFGLNTALADGLAIDKVDHPYVEPDETELEWRMLNADGYQLQRVALGAAVTDNMFIEGYLIGEKEDDNFHLEGYEFEMKWQLTEQGEYAIDWGVVTEFEKSHEEDEWEFTTGLLMEKAIQRWSARVNLRLGYEWGDDIDNEYDVSLASQLRYRLMRGFEPAIEFYAGQDTRAIGPVILGDVHFSPGKNLHWETGILFGVEDETPDTTLRFLAEYEF